MLRTLNDLFRIRIQLWTFQSSGSGSNSLFKQHWKYKKTTLNFIEKQNFSISKCSPTVPVHNPEFTGLKLKINIYLSSLSFFAGSDPCGPGSATLLVRVILRPVGEGKPQNYRWQNRKVWCLSRRFLKVGLPACRNEECLSRRRGGQAGTALAHPPTAPIPHARPRWGTYVVCGCWRASTTARATC